MKKIKSIISAGLVFTPFLALAQTAVTDLESLFQRLTEILNFTIPLLIAIAVIILIVGIIKYITAGDDEEGRKNARNLMIYGIIGLFVIISVWGLVAILEQTFDTGGGVVPIIPIGPSSI